MNDINQEETREILINKAEAASEGMIINGQEKAWDRFIRNTAIFLSSAE